MTANIYKVPGAVLTERAHVAACVLPRVRDAAGDECKRARRRHRNAFDLLGDGERIAFRDQIQCRDEPAACSFLAGKNVQPTERAP